MPKKRARDWGDEYRSSDDEDYLPPGSPDQPRMVRRRAPRAAPGAGDDVPLAARRRSLLAAAGPAAPSAARAQPSRRAPDLPLEVLHNVLRQACAEGGGVPSAAAAACVSRAWRAAVATCPEVWAAVDLSYGWARPTDEALAAAAPRWAPALRTLSLAGCGRVSETGLAALAAACPLLSSLDLSSCTGFRDTGLADALCAMAARPVTATSAPLTSLNLSFAQIAPKGSGLDAVLKRLLAAQADNPTEGPVLQRLVVEGCPSLSHRPLRAVCDASVAAGRPLLGALRELSLAGSAGLCGDFSLNVLRLQLAAPALERLNLCHVARAAGWELKLSASGLQPGAAAAASWPRLRSLRVTADGGGGAGRAMIDLRILGQMISGAEGLEELAFVGFGRVYADELAGALPRGAPLRRLTLDGTVTAVESDTHAAPSLARLFFLQPWLLDSLEELSAVGCGGAMDDAAAAAAAGGAALRAVDARETAVGEAGVRALLEGARARGLLGPGGRCRFALDIASCRGVERRVRQAASRGTAELARELGYM